MIKIPYGNTYLQLCTDHPSVEVLESRVHFLQSNEDEDDIVRKAMSNPIGTPRLSEMAVNKKSVVIIISDHTRPVPSKHIIPFMLSELRNGNPDIEITLLVATGCHRETTKDELINKLGEDIVLKENIIIHDCLDEDAIIDIGELPSGARLVVNRLAVECDLLVAEGFIEPHFFAGFSGGRKSVLPGICSRTTVLGNHCAQFIDSPYARTGILENNPIQRDMEAAAKMAGLSYIVNVVINEDKRVVAAFAGHPLLAHQKGCEWLKDYCRVKPAEKGDILVTSNGGWPLDQNVYQSVKGLTAAEAAAKDNAVIIMCARCDDGSGSEDMHRTLKECDSADELLAEIRKIPMDQTQPDQWQYQILARIITKHRVIFVTDPENRKMVEEMKLEYASNLDEALNRAFEYKGRNSHLVVIPNGISVIVEE